MSYAGFSHFVVAHGLPLWLAMAAWMLIMAIIVIAFVLVAVSIWWAQRKVRADSRAAWAPTGWVGASALRKPRPTR